MTFEEAVEIYMTNAQADMEAKGWNGQVNQPGINDSYLKGGIWYMRNVNGHLARIGTKCRCVLADVTRNPE